MFFRLTAALAEKPMDVIQTGVDKVFGILNDPGIRPGGQKGRAARQNLVGHPQLFRFRHYRQRNVAPPRLGYDFPRSRRREFIDLFTDLIGETYLERIQGEFKNEKVVYGEQEMLSDSKALVKTTIVRESLEIPVDYRLYLKNGNWRIYNVYVENTSLVTNYRDQFSRILMKGTPSELIEKLREKDN